MPNLATLDFHDRDVRMRTLAEKLGGSVSEKDFPVIIDFLQKIHIGELHAAWATVEDLKKVTLSDCDEVIKGARLALWNQQKGF